MKVFLSWSGTKSQKVANEFRDWLPLVMQHVDIYMSSEDIDKGSQWFINLTTELENTFFGILLVTKENFEAPWMIFEAGALSKGRELTKVSPFLFGIKVSELTGPLSQFQATDFNKKDVRRLLTSINNNSLEENKMDEGRLSLVYENWWPILEEKLNDHIDYEEETIITEKVKKIDQSMILEEILSLTRNQNMLLRKPENLLPPSYVRSILKKSNSDLGSLQNSNSIFSYLLENNKRHFSEVRSWMDAVKEKSKPYLSNKNIQDFDNLMQKMSNIIRVTMRRKRIEEKHQMDL